MARTSQFVQVGKHKLELSNLEKVLYPEGPIVKAEVIQYYLKIAPTILNHIKGRPLTLVRYPDGVTKQAFYQKNRPDYVPDWIESATLGKEKKVDFMIAKEAATLVFLANLACLEFHQLHCRHPNFDHPDYIVFDLDPPEGYDFKKLIPLALELKKFVEGYGYVPFVKTTGGKGVHIVCPIEAKWSFHDAFEAASDIANPFVEDNSKQATLHIKKEARKGKVLIDIYRLRSGQSIISPYSLRGRDAAPVSMPLRWDELAELSNPKKWNIKTALDYVLEFGDAWEGISAYAVPLHTKKKASTSKKKAKKLPLARTYKTPEQLKSYEDKRDFKKTSEPSPKIHNNEGNAFVIHRHHASRLHYDLRLEVDGVLRSWAVPRGMPPRPGIKRLAVEVEEHPMKYLTFEGVIPKGQYGAGPMWVYATGRYERTKEKKNGFYFQLHSPEMTGEYRMHVMKDKEWLLERVDEPQIKWLKEPVQPMLADSSKTIPTGDQYIYEIKWDGIRAIITIDEENFTIRTRNQLDVTNKFPELQTADPSFRTSAAVFDAEIVCLDKDGKPAFDKVIRRIQQSNEKAILRMSQKFPAYCYVFDCLYLDGRSLIHEPLHRRKEWLFDAMKKNTNYRFSEHVAEGEHLKEAAQKLGLEGIMSKDRNSRYFPGKRSDSWTKVKFRERSECVIIGYTEGKGNRENVFGALQIAEIIDERQVYRGKVGTGFADKQLIKIYKELDQMRKIKKPIKQKLLDDAVTTWIEPVLYCDIQYSSITKNETFREPVFIRMRPDLQQ